MITMKNNQFCYPMRDDWFPACGGTEKPFTSNGVRWLYVYNPMRHKHGYLNLDTDIVNDDKNFCPEL